jgi:uncharacterized membrane protein YphA (DoxX/SURF4 family)
MTSTTLASNQNLTAGTRMIPGAVLWTVQVVLALLFMFAGVMKLITPAEVMQAQSPDLSVAFLRFIGAAEVLGALGLVLPGLLRIRRELTPLAAAGLLIIMTGATVLTALDAITMAAIPLTVGLLTALVAYGRWRWLA